MVALLGVGVAAVAGGGGGGRDSLYCSVSCIDNESSEGLDVELNPCSYLHYGCVRI
eukprot:COSAG05_NODE_175_length_14930_cov_7.138679_6_plen_56_part_00